jgi:hypothetical protein
MHVVTLFVTLAAPIAALIAQAPDGGVIEVPGGTRATGSGFIRAPGSTS